MKLRLRKAVTSGQSHADRRNRSTTGTQMIRMAWEAPETRTCKFIAGEDHYMCGAEALPGKPYCADHWRLTHRPYDGDDAA